MLNRLILLGPSATQSFHMKKAHFDSHERPSKLELNNYFKRGIKCRALKNDFLKHKSETERVKGKMRTRDLGGAQGWHVF